MRKLRHRVEYAGARLALALAALLPPRALLALARGLASLAFSMMGGRRSIAVDNLMSTGVAQDRHDAERIARLSFQSIALAVVESLIVPRLLAEPDARRVRISVDAPPETLAALDNPDQGIILVSAHIGNWELAAKVCSRHKQVTGIARKMNNPLVQELIERRGIRDGMNTIDKHDAHPMKIVRVLRRHEMLALLVDQHASGENAVTIGFLGKPAKSYTTPAILQRLTGAPILVGAAIRNGPLDFTLHFSEPIYFGLGKDSGDIDILRATQSIADRLCAYIRRWPEQYLWAHRRWKT